MMNRLIAKQVDSIYIADGSRSELNSVNTSCKDEKVWCKMADCSLSNVAKICQKTCGSCWSFILQLALWIYIGPNADRQNVQRNIGAHFFEYFSTQLSFLFVH